MTGSISVVVEIPKGSRNKYEMNPATGRIHLDRMLFTSVQYPADYGFVEETLAEDGDALDALVLVGAPTFPGCVIEVRPVGVFHMTDDKGVDDKILTVPVGDPLWSSVNTLTEVPGHLLNEIAHFFAIYKDLEGKKVITGGWGGEDEAVRIIESSRAAFFTPRETSA
ncbi:MAG TPA: inorganic diphosphatase [Actinomycetota bacterium]